jgi:hypothetical protein
MSDFRPTKKEGDRYEADGTQGLIDTYSTKGIHAGVTARPERCGPMAQGSERGHHNRYHSL